MESGYFSRFPIVISLSIRLSILGHLFLIITIVVAFAAVEFRKVELTGEHIILKTFENVVSIQKEEEERKVFMENRYSCFVECYEIHFVACNLIMNLM